MTSNRILGCLVLGATLLAACGSSSSKTGTTGNASTTTSAESSPPGAMFSVKPVAALGQVIVDGRGHTVYVLTADGKTSLPCDDASGCTKAWPDLSLPDGVSAAKSGEGLDESLLGTRKVGDETYPTYHGWLLYEFSGDTAPGQGNGEGIKSFGGVWYALNAQGGLVMPAGAPATTTSSAAVKPAAVPTTTSTRSTTAPTTAAPPTTAQPNTTSPPTTVPPPTTPPTTACAYPPCY